MILMHSKLENQSIRECLKREYKNLSEVLFCRERPLKLKISFVPETTTKALTQMNFQEIFSLITFIFPFSQLSVG